MSRIRGGDDVVGRSPTCPDDGRVSTLRGGPLIRSQATHLVQIIIVCFRPRHFSTSPMTIEQEPSEGQQHLNSTGCLIKVTPEKGRGVYG